ncbi:hypothetical protein PpBr36_07093 [Pyricularia pennisetigena]|uniref:hypothetical protein n=1 Tax=Pyricularia pennisetigena TaxID=1578925 RepID=UPI0011510C89|nr:hypothetical protein PpBr36_07093 [Pyricularia pennisetigena]TLS25274.1 hypothetical protein PpBr36_07093 [Pyricularia pennisetigena]
MSTKDMGAAGTSSQQAVTEASSSRVVPKPVPQTQVQDARAYQLQQLRKRYSPRESTLNGGVTSLRFSLKPSDPDFPYELDYLEVELKIPSSYPKQPPTISVKNQDIPRGFGVNIERGWDKLVEERKGATTLLSLTNALDRNLETFLSEQKAETVKMTIFKDTRHLDAMAAEATSQPEAVVQAPPQRRPLYRPETFTKEQIAEAKARRAQEARQLEARMGRLPLYQKSSDGIVYTLPLDPKRRSELPVGLRPVKSVQLIIPLLYPLQQIRVLLNDVESDEAEPVEELFAEKAAAQRAMSLMSHVNYLTQNIHVLAKQAQANREAALAEERMQAKVKSKAEDVDGHVKAAAHVSSLDDVKGHVKVIPRPPEWSYGNAGESESDSEDSYDSDEDGQGGASLGPQDAQEEPTSSFTRTTEKGTAITFPSIELFGVEILEINTLSISVKCLRCKTNNDLGGLKPNLDKVSSCKKCATEFVATFRPELVHQNSTRAGFVNLSGCTITDLLPSTFVPTCSKCSTAAAHGFVSVRGDATTNVCRECHGRFTFKIPEVKLQSYSSGAASLPPTSGPRRRQEKLGLHAGEPLPARGACEHYKKSYRWFRFSCCDRVSACDKCHDAEADGHVHEWANRMICGWCSREQNYRVDSCGFCGRSVVGRRGTGYWEGGKGTRDQVLMRRNDKRKHRRIGGGESKKKE